MIKVIGNKYEGKGKEGDFEMMIESEDFENCLFIFNDNEEMHETCRKGKGNAAIRIYNKYALDIPKSAGIPTGNFKNRGYKSLNERNKKIIDDAIREIEELIYNYRYDYVVFSEGDDGLIGTGLFNVCEDVRRYITNKIYELEELY